MLRNPSYASSLWYICLFYEYDGTGTLIDRKVLGWLQKRDEFGEQVLEKQENSNGNANEDQEIFGVYPRKQAEKSNWWV